MFWGAANVSYLSAAAGVSSPDGEPDCCPESDGPYYDLGVYGHL